MDDVEASWFAGFYEGEGTISNDVSNNMRYRIHIYQNDKTPLEIGRVRWGGSIRKIVKKSPASEKICTCHQWSLSYKSAKKFIDDIFPYMKIPYKIQQIQDAKERCKLGIVRRFRCMYCELDYASPSGRRRHVKAFHSEIQALVP